MKLLVNYIIKVLVCMDIYKVSIFCMEYNNIYISIFFIGI